MGRFRRLPIAVLAITTLPGGCGDEVVPPPVPTSIILSPASATFQSFAEITAFTATVLDQHGDAMPNVSVTWTVRDQSVATVGSGGIVTAKGNGMTVVMASVEDASGTANLTVDQVPCGGRITAGRHPGRTWRHRAARGGRKGCERPPDRRSGFLLGVGNPVRGYRGRYGLVTATANGTTIVTVLTGGASGGASVTGEQQVAAVTVSPQPDTLAALGDTVRLSARAADANGPGSREATLSWVQRYVGGHGRRLRPRDGGGPRERSRDRLGRSVLGHRLDPRGTGGGTGHRDAGRHHDPDGRHVAPGGGMVD